MEQLQTARQRFTDDILDGSLKIAWDLLRAADHPATAPESARQTRRMIAQAILRAAREATDIDDLWLAGIDAVRSEACPQRQGIFTERV
jgi:hypothetical protein